MYMYDHCVLIIIESYEAKELKSDKSVLRLAVQSMLNAKYGMVLPTYIHA